MIKRIARNKVDAKKREILEKKGLKSSNNMWSLNLQSKKRESESIKNNENFKTLFESYIFFFVLAYYTQSLENFNDFNTTVTYC